MGKLLTIVVLLLSFSIGQAQFSTNNVQVRLGYNLSNVHAKRFNHLVSEFNNSRYPHIVAENLPNLNWMHGVVVGANYDWTDDFQLHAVLKSRRQFLETAYANSDMRRSYLFRMHSLEVGASMNLREEGRFSHFVGAGVVLGVMGVFTNWTDVEGYEGSKNMINIDHTASVGLSLHYEARFRLHDNIQIFIRPVAQYALDSHVRRLTDFFDPKVDEGKVTYGTGAAVKYDSGTLNGLGVEGGLIFVLPEL
jgi:hypothetical protein